MEYPIFSELLIDEYVCYRQQIGRGEMKDSNAMINLSTIVSAFAWKISLNIITFCPPLLIIEIVHNRQELIGHRTCHGDRDDH